MVVYHRRMFLLAHNASTVRANVSVLPIVRAQVRQCIALCGPNCATSNFNEVATKERSSMREFMRK